MLFVIDGEYVSLCSQSKWNTKSLTQWLIIDNQKFPSRDSTAVFLFSESPSKVGFFSVLVFMFVIDILFTQALPRMSFG